jgi:hypothetical protein
MSETGDQSMHRRGFIQAGAAVTAAVTTLPQAAQAQGQGQRTANAKTVELPRRVLGKTGVEVTILND